MKKRLFYQRQRTYAEQDFHQIRQMINSVAFSVENAKKQLYPDYRIGQILCAGHLVSIEIADMSSTGNGIWIQVRDQKTVQLRPSFLHKRPTRVYINTLIQLLDSYKQEDILKPQLQLRPFGMHYEY